MQLVSIGVLAGMLGVAVITLRRWDRSGRLQPAARTAGGHRRYDLEVALRALGLERPQGKTFAYARVSSHDQKLQLEWQAERLRQHCAGMGEVEVVADLGSGLNMRKPGLNRLLRAILTGECARLVLVTKDRLLRFGSELIFNICRWRGIEVVILDETEALSREAQLAADLVEILTVFSSRLYGSRSRKNLRACVS